MASTTQQRLLRLRGRVALISGVSRRSGIGAAIARTLASEGANIFTTWYSPYDQTMPWGGQAEEAGAILSELRQMGVQAAGIEQDLSDPGAAAQIVDAAERAVGPVDILVANAAVSRNADLLKVTASLLDEAYAINMRATLLLCTQFASRYACRTRPTGEVHEARGRIILLTSGQGQGPMPEEIPYVCTKAAMDVLARSAAPTLATRGITINAIDPGATDSGWMTPQQYEQIKQANPMGRVGFPDDAARLVAFLASDEARWITGQVIRSTGGGW